MGIYRARRCAQHCQRRTPSSLFDASIKGFYEGLEKGSFSGNSVYGPPGAQRRPHTLDRLAGLRKLGARTPLCPEDYLDKPIPQKRLSTRNVSHLDGNAASSTPGEDRIVGFAMLPENGGTFNAVDATYPKIPVVRRATSRSTTISRLMTLCSSDISNAQTAV